MTIGPGAGPIVIETAAAAGGLSGLMTMGPGAGHVVIEARAGPACGRGQPVAASWARRAAGSVVGAWQA